jgi:hypothetical protein
MLCQFYTMKMGILIICKVVIHMTQDQFKEANSGYDLRYSSNIQMFINIAPIFIPMFIPKANKNVYTSTTLPYVYAKA